ncbi:MAG TPA: glycosyltransferase family A protein [Candidatus Methylomirabilis sp.]|nr:glycosyltransferase family A protein [Candidatus Methylomirabilis sp.]
MKLSVVICTRDRHEMIGQALESVAASAYPSFDVHVMDQSTTTVTRELVEGIRQRYAAKCPIHYHHLDRIGLSHASNAGVHTSDGEVIAFTDDDVVVPTDWLTKIADVFETDAQAGLVYGQVLVPEDLSEACRQGAEVPSVWFDRRERMVKGRGFKVRGMAANMAIRRSLFVGVGGFDEALGGGGPLRSSQDCDFAFRTYRFGMAIVLVPEVRVDHYGARTPEQWADTLKNYGIGDGAFYSKHIRCGDLRALWLFLKGLLRRRARQIRDLLKEGRWRSDPYADHLFQGVRDAWKFAIDRERRLFRETPRARMTAMPANAVTPSRPRRDPR